MTRRYRQCLIAAPLLLAACGTAKATDTSGETAPRSSSTAEAGMSGMNMQNMPGMSMPGMAGEAATGPGTPSAASKMICSTEIRRDVATLLSLPALPHVVSSWANSRYDCTYHLPIGSLRISVQESPSKPAALAYFQQVRGKHADAHPLTGVASFGLPAFQAADGVVAFAKDDSTLLVDPTGLPATAGHSTRSEFAYTVASDIIGCWNGD